MLLSHAFIFLKVKAPRLTLYYEKQNIIVLLYSQITHSNDVDDPIYLSHASFSWGGKTDPVQLRDLNWRVREGQLVAVVGIVGSGKSSLLSSLLGDMQRVEGEAYIKEDERIAYVPQQAWMQNTTLQNNILFGKPYNNDLYERVRKK